MTGKIKVIIENRQKEVKIPTGLRMLIRRCCNAVLKMENFDGSAEVSVNFVSTEEIQQLNREYRGKDIPTDVLSFPLGENGVYDVNHDTGAYLLGDIVICMQKAVDQAKLYSHSLQREVGFLTAHSMLHLLGYDHENGGLEAMHMREKEEAVLELLGLPSSASYVLEDDGKSRIKSGTAFVRQRAGSCAVWRRSAICAFTRRRSRWCCCFRCSFRFLPWNTLCCL